MTGLSRLGLGTVQFGADYGVSNRRGRPSEREVAAILARAVERGIGYIDTASAYGDAETLIGRHLPPAHNMRIVTKVPAISAERLEPIHGRYALDVLAASCARMRVDAVYGLLIHQAADLAKPGWEYLVDAIMEAKAQGLVSRIGASIYNGDQLAIVEKRFLPELIQLPLNVLDRRAIISGLLARLQSAGVEIHARSIFLQGLLLMDPHELPEFFAPIRTSIVGVHAKWRQCGLSAIDGCLAFALQRSEIDAVLVGVNSLKEFQQIELAASSARMDIGVDVDQAIDSLFVDPNCWPSFVN